MSHHRVLMMHARREVKSRELDHTENISLADRAGGLCKGIVAFGSSGCAKYTLVFVKSNADGFAHDVQQLHWAHLRTRSRPAHWSVAATDSRTSMRKCSGKYRVSGR